MSATSILTLVATLLSVEGDVASIDKGILDGLRAGDTGGVFYTLLVGADRKETRIEVGRLVVLEVEESTATLRVAPDVGVRSGYSVEFQIPRDRFSPTGRPDEPIEAQVETAAEAETIGPAAEEASEPRVSIPMLHIPMLHIPMLHIPMLHIPGGVYTVGVDLGEAQFYNQSPRFQVDVQPFRIDPAPVTRAEFLEIRSDFSFATEVSFDDAREHCRGQDKRLPSELEWEIAVRTPGVMSGNSIYEWTESWYQPYPGNRFPEEEYGESFRVLRGTSNPGEVNPWARRFMAPELKRPDVGFRCVRSALAGGS